ncbi:MAG: heparinase II/III family protein [Planctomycetota bacterium]|nr:heparinase II/III family protein [Planctomycetota bacterium]
MHGTAWLEIDGRGKVLEKADGLLRGIFRNAWPDFGNDGLGARPDWHRGIDLQGTSIARNVFAVELSTAFALTGKVAYARKALEYMRAYAEGVPFVLEPGFHEDHDRYFGGRGNETLTLIYRCVRWIDVMHSGVMHAPGVFSDEDVFWLVKSLWFYAMQFYRFVGDAMRRDNHHLVDHGHAPFVLGIMFPEFSVARALLDQGRKTILHHFGHNVFADGGYAEHSTKYQYHITYHYLNPMAIAKANGLRLFSPAQEALLAKWVEFNAHACKPDGVLSDFGDEFGGSHAYLFGSLAVPVMSPRLAALARALGYEPGSLSYESPAALAARFKHWKPGKAPRVGLSPHFEKRKAPAKPAAKVLPVPAAQYPHGGYTFLRSAWTKDADYMAVAHYTDCLPHGHAHWDMLSFVLHTQGVTLIGDPATWIYTDKRNWESQEMRGYAYAVDAHNCLVMNDDTLKPIKALGHGCCWGGYPPKHGLGLLRTGGPIEVAELWHDAYAPTRHRRYVVHVCGLGFVFVDLLSRPGLDLRPHQYSQLFHFEGGVEITPGKPAAGQTLRAWKEPASCLIVPGAEAETKWKAWRDERLANLYGVSRSPEGKRGPAPWVAELTRRIQGPSVFTNFLITRPSMDVPSVPSARYLGSEPARWLFQQHEGLSAHALDLGRHGTLYVASCPYGKTLEHAELATDAELAVVLADARGKNTAWCMAKGSRLRVRGRKLYAGKRSDWRS